MGQKKEPFEIGPDGVAVAFVGDTHINGTTGLCPPDGFTLADGGYYGPSPWQSQVWKIWQEFWRDFVPPRIGNAPLCTVLGGDIVEGNHHGTSQTISRNHHDQQEFAVKVLSPVCTLSTKGVYMLRGTPAHAGEAGHDEERIAAALGCKPDAGGRRARQVLRLQVGQFLVEALHHGSGGAAGFGEAGGLARELADVCIAAARNKQAVPDLVVRHHVHRACQVHIPMSWGSAVGLAVPSWQLTTGYGYKLRGARVNVPQVGAALAVFYPTHFVVHSFTRFVPLVTTETLRPKRLGGVGGKATGKAPRKGRHLGAGCGYIR